MPLKSDRGSKEVVEAEEVDVSVGTVERERDRAGARSSGSAVERDRDDKAATLGWRLTNGEARAELKPFFPAIEVA